MNINDMIKLLRDPFIPNYLLFVTLILILLVVNTGALLLKLGNERQPPDIPQELSTTAKDFLAK